MELLTLERRFIITYTRNVHKVEVLGTDSELFANALFSALCEVIDQQQANHMELHRRYFEFDLSLCDQVKIAPLTRPRQWAKELGSTDNSERQEVIDLRPTGEQYPMRGMNLDTYRGTD